MTNPSLPTSRNPAGTTTGLVWLARAATKHVAVVLGLAMIYALGVSVGVTRLLPDQIERIVSRFFGI